MSTQHAYFFTKSRIALSLVLLTHVQVSAWAKDLVGPGASHTINEGDPITTWTLRDQATLTVENRGQTDAIRSHGSTVHLSGASANSGATSALYLEGSNSSIQSSYLNSSATTALNIAQTSTATVSDSTITGVGRGVNVAMNSTATLLNTHVLGIDNGGLGPLGGGIGLALVNSKAEVGARSQIIGEASGIVMTAERFGGLESSLTLDNAHVAGNTQSAIKVLAALHDRAPITTIDIRNGTTLSGGNGVILEVTGGSSAKVDVSNSVLTGDIVSDTSSHTTLNLRDHASLTGGISHVEQLSVGSTALWTLTKDSNLQTLQMDNGRVNLGGDLGNFHQLSVESLSGSGTFGLAVDLNAGLGDKLVVSGEASGTHQLAIRNTGTDVTQGQDTLEVVQTGGGDAHFAVLGGQVDLGTFAYDLERFGDDWRLVQRKDVITPGARSVLALFNATPTVWYGELSTLRSRMGELRMGSGESGAWGRAYGNKYNVSAAAGTNYQQRQHGISLGADGTLPIDNGQALLGVMGGYSQSNLDLGGGTSGNVDSFYVGAYGTWLAEDGYYLDALMKLNRFQSDSDVRMSDGTMAGGQYSQYGLGASLEAGRRIALTDSVFVAPFGQLSTLWVQGQQYSLDNGMQGKSSNANSLLGKLGSQIGQSVALGAGGRFDYYAKAALAHEFANNNRSKVNDNAFNNDLSGSRGEFGVGTALQVSDRVQLHADLDYSNGRKIEQPWGLNLGARYNW